MTESRGAPRLTLIAAFAAVYILWGSTYLAIRFADETMPPLIMGGVRFVIAGGALFLVATLGRERARPRPIHWLTTGIVGTCLLVTGNGLVILAERVVPSSLAALLLSIVPLWMILVDWLRPHGVRPRLVAVFGVILGFGGVALLIAPTISSLPPLDLLSYFLIPLAALSWAIGSVYARGARLPASALLSNGMEMLIGGALLLLLASVSGEWGQLNLAAISLKSGLAFLFLILFGSIVGFSAYTYVLRHTPLALASTYAYVNPIVAVFLGWALAGEPITPTTLIAAAIIVGSVVIISFTRATPAPAATPPAQPAPAIAATALAEPGPALAEPGPALAASPLAEPIPAEPASPALSAAQPQE